MRRSGTLTLVTVAEFIVETQWTLLILLLVAALVVGMVSSERFRNAILERNVRIGTDGFSLEHPPADPATLEAATATDEEIARVVGGVGEPADEAAVTAYRREVVEQLVEDAVHFGWRMKGIGYSRVPHADVDWDAEGGPRVRHSRGHGAVVWWLSKDTDHGGAQRERGEEAWEVTREYDSRHWRPPENDAQE